MSAVAAGALAAVPNRRDFAFSADGVRAAWIVDDTVEWADDASGTTGRFTSGGPLPSGTHLELVSPGCVGVCRSSDSGVELARIEIDGAVPASRLLASFVTPRSCLLPRVPGDSGQLLAVTRFDDTTTMYRIDWVGGVVSETGRLPFPVTGGVWIAPGSTLALNLLGPQGRSSVYRVDLAAEQFGLLMESSPDNEDRAVLFDRSSGYLVLTTDAPGYPAVGVARLDRKERVRFFPALSPGDEAGVPLAFATHRGRRQIVLRHEEGTWARLRLADPETLEISSPLPVPDGEVNGPVAVTGEVLRFAYSAPDLPWCAARFHLDGSGFTLDAAACGAFRTGRAMTLPSPSGPMPALVLTPTESNRVAVVMLHGGPIARHGGGFSPEAQLFAALGCTVVALDYPGSTGWGQSHMRALFGAAGTIDVDAVAGVVDRLAGEGHEVVLYGESYGAFLALATAAVRPCAGIVAFAPFASFERLYRYGTPEVREVLELLDGGNSDDTGRNVLEVCRIIRSKVLIAHGTADRTIPVAESRLLVEALRERNGAGEGTVRFVELEGQGHELTSRNQIHSWYREIAHFVGGLPEPRSPAR
ncbi:MAG: alpha/beta hydrolase family protein [Acidimicrobiia bacterium]